MRTGCVLDYIVSLRLVEFPAENITVHVLQLGGLSDDVISQLEPPLIMWNTLRLAESSACIRRGHDSLGRTVVTGDAGMAVLNQLLGRVEASALCSEVTREKVR